MSIKNRGIKLIRIKPQFDVLGQLGTSDLHPTVLPGLLIEDFVDAVVVKVPDFPSPVTPADPGFREAVVIVMTMSHKNKTRYTKTNKTKNMSLYIKTTIFHVVIYGESYKGDEEYPVADDIGNRWAMLLYI